MSDEVSDFLRSVELLKGRREEEDEARSRELEQKILQEKAERQARRLERARSISPQKSSPANTTGHHHRASIASIASIASTILPPDGVDLSSPSPAQESTGSPRARSVQLSDNAMEPLSLASPTKENESPSSPPPFDSSEPSKRLTSPSAAMPAARPLSWQRRPTSQASERPKSRPLSVFAAENAAATRANAGITSPTEEQPPQSPTDDLPSRDSIAQSLAGKDPSWFKQTADRGQGSAAYRKSQVEDEDIIDTSDLSRTQLPGMTQDADANAPTSTEPESTPSRQSLLNSPLITSAPRLDPPTGDAAHDEPEPPSNRLSMMSPNSRASPATPRSGSPTKGLGGFVQSAMMKRSDSVKRWSVNSPGLARAESTASNRNSILGSQLGSPTKQEAQPDATTQDDSNSKPTSRPASRPISSHGEDRPVTPAPLTINPQLAAVEIKETSTEGGEEDNTSVPVSPSKTMDPRRWSPSKSSSWLEAALNKPESPKTKPAPNANQPAWMVELNKAKAQKTGNTSVDLSRSASVPLRKTEVKTGGLMRTTPVGSGLKSSSGPGLSISTSAPATEKPTVIGSRSDLVSPLLRRGSEDPASVAKTPTTEEATPALKDFRANLKSRVPPPSSAGAEGEVDELKNVFGKLRRAKTEKWVAPDPLKDNILRGKSLLNHTGGPMKNERKDELKEAILKKKEEFQKAKQEGQSPTKVASPVVSEKPIPEALARRLELGRSGSFSSKSADLPSSASSVTSPSVASPTNILDFDRTGLLSPKKREITDIAAQIAPKPATSPEKEASATNEVQSTTPKPVTIPGRLSKVGGLADRFNPALAGMLARGPPAAASGASKESGAAEGDATPKPGPQLTHMTKNRARGPRRKAPTSVLKPAEETKETTETPEVESPPAAKETVTSPVEEKQVTPTMPKPEFITRVESRASVQSHRHSRSGSVADLVNSFKTKVAEEPKPAEQSNTADLPSRSPTKITRGRSATKVLEQATVFAALNQQPSESAEAKSEVASASPARPALGHTRSKSKVHEQAALFTTLSRQPSEATEPTKEPASQSPVRPALGHTRSKSKVQEQAAAFVNKMKAEPTERSAETSPVRPAMGHTRSKSKVHEQIAALAAASHKPSDAAADAAPSTPTSARGRSRAKSIVQEQLAALATAGQQTKPAEPEADIAAQAASPRKLDMKRMSRFLDEQTQPILNPETEKTSRPSSPVKQRALPDFPRTSSTKDVSPVKDTKVDSEPVISVKAGSALFGGGANAGLPQVTTKPTSPPPTEPAAPAPTSLPPRGLVKTPTPEPKTDLPPRLPLTALSSPSFTSSRRPSVPENTPTPEPQPQPQPEVQSPPPPKVPPKGARPLPATPEVEAPPVPRKDSVALPFLPKFDFQSQPQQQPQQPAQQQPQPQPQPQSPQQQPPPHGLRHTRSASKYGSDAQALLSDFFGTERPRRRYMADAADVIMRRPNPGFRIQTQRAQLYQFAADGKKLPVPAHRERILFEREMYLCTHTFTNESGKKVSEVYFWVGDEVPEAATDDAMLFAAREARAFGGKLVKMVQGKETSEFMQALGGIVIIRRGSSNKFDSLAQTMFCGRRFLGQVAFDEVDFAPSSLCSGFPYLITQQGKCYLWKGKGSDVDELGCARLVGMDLSLMGELEEIEEGYEPESFWRDIFGGEGPGVRPMSADHWRLKPNYEKYCGRLFCSNANASGKDQIVEISPFKQTDLLSTNIYILDAFFEMYIIVGSRSQHQYASFHNALDFAQEYSILAAGMEDRPFVPISTVVLEGIPRDLKSVFRKWSDSLSPTIMNHLGSNVSVGPTSPPADVRSPGSVRSFSNSSIMSQAPGSAGQGQQGPGLRRGRSLRIVPLNQALKALQD